MSHPYSTNPNSASERLKHIRSEFGLLVEKYGQLAKIRIEGGIREYLALVRDRYTAADARAIENDNLCRVLLESGRLSGDIRKGQLWDNGYFRPLVPAFIATKVKSTGELSLDEDETREVAERCLEWAEFQRRVGSVINEKAAATAAFDKWNALHEKRSKALLKKLSAPRSSRRSALTTWERALAESISRAKTKFAGRKRARSASGSLSRELRALCEYHVVEITPRFACSTVRVPPHPLDLTLQDLQCMEDDKGTHLSFARLAGLSDALSVRPEWTSEKNACADDPIWFSREVDALLSLRPINWGRQEGELPQLDAAALNPEFAAEMLRAANAALIEDADWISSAEVIALCGFTSSQLQMAASRGKIQSQNRGSLKWYRRSHLRHEYPKETSGIL